MKNDHSSKVLAKKNLAKKLLSNRLGKTGNSANLTKATGATTKTKSVAQKVAQSVKMSFQEKTGQVATRAAVMSSKLVSNVAQGLAKSRLAQGLKSASNTTKFTGNPDVRKTGTSGLSPKATQPTITKFPLKAKVTKGFSGKSTQELRELSKATEDGLEGARKKVSSKALGLSASQMKELEKRLSMLQIELKEQLEGKAGIYNTSVQAESVIKGDDAEVAEKQRVSNAALQEMDFLKNRLALVNRALAKIESGFYGMCEETEEPIGYERLTVVPWARFSVSIQESLERKMRDYQVNRLRAEG